MFKSNFFARLMAILCFSFIFITNSKVQAQSLATIPGDFADPSVIYANGRYYAVGTSSEWAPHLPVYSSSNLKEWKQEGFIFTETPEWTKSSYWAPEFYYQNGTYYVYYSAKRKSDGKSCIGVATSKFPDRGYVDHGVVVEYGTESIDAFIVKEGDQLYMTWKAYGLDERPIELLGSKLSADGLRLEGEPFSMLQDTARVGIEGQSFIHKDGYYYMFYSAGACCGSGCDYRVQAVRSKSFEGPYEHVGETVLLGNNEDWKCMGHGTFVQDKKGDYYYVFHGYNQKGTIYTGREGLLAKLVWSYQGAPVFDFIPNPANNKSSSFRLDFSKLKKNAFFGQYDFRNAKNHWTLDKKGLTLSGEIWAPNIVGNVLTWRPALPVYTIQSTVDLKQSSVQALKGISIYGDQDRSLGIGIQGQNIQIWIANPEGFKVLKTVAAPTGASHLELQIQTHADQSCTASFKDQTGTWQKIDLGQQPGFSLKDMAPWDRSPRPGVHFKGSTTEKAVFKNFSLAY